MALCAGGTDHQQLLDLEASAFILSGMRRDQGTDRLGTRSSAPGAVVSPCSSACGSMVDHLYGFSDDLAAAWEDRLGAAIQRPVAGGICPDCGNQLHCAQSAVGGIWHRNMKTHDGYAPSCVWLYREYVSPGSSTAAWKPAAMTASAKACGSWTISGKVL